MAVYKLFDRVTMAVAICASISFLWANEYEAASAAIAIWPLSRALVSIIDVFYTFFTDRPLVRSERPTASVDTKSM